MSPRPGGEAGRRPAFPVSSCDCENCRAACNNSPGWFTPDQIAPLARHLQLTVEETFARFLAVGVTRLNDGSLCHGVMPHKFQDGKKPGSVWTLAELARPGRCIFFDHGRCSIYPVRPHECARMIHNRTDQSIRLRLTIVPRWTRAALKLFAKLTGKPLTGADAPGRKR